MSGRSFLFTTTRCCLTLVGAAGLGCIAALLTAILAAVIALLVVPVFASTTAVGGGSAVAGVGAIGAGSVIGAGVVVGMLVFVVSAPLVWRATW